jgi:pyrimidine-nucleoside phosphorylase
MNVTDLIRKKRDGGELSEAEIGELIGGLGKGEVPDYQTTALLMAVFFRGLSAKETGALALAMAHSGEMLDLSGLPGSVDKHSTGGVGDKTTMVVAPLVAAAGVPVAKLSGRALGHTSGTIDRLESIPGFRTNLSTEEMLRQVKAIGVAVAAQSDRLVPADKKLYALRDRTATVESVPLIAASVMSKKLAGGASGVLLDVKCGRGAFMATLPEAKLLAETMVAIGKAAGRKMLALITAMEQPLGRAVGEAIEVGEALETLAGKGPGDFRELCLLVASHMVYLGGKAESPEGAGKQLLTLLDEGKALNKFKQMVEAQGGEVKALEDGDYFNGAKYRCSLKADKSGFIRRINAHIVGEVARDLVADHRGGIMLAEKVGAKVEAGDELAGLLADKEEKLDGARLKLATAYEIGEIPPEVLPLLLLPAIE